MINYVAEYIEYISTSLPSIIFFTIIVGVCSFGCYFILGFVADNSKDIRSKDLRLNVIHWVVTAVQYILISIIVFLLLEILLLWHYDTVLLIAAALISEIIAAGLLALFAQRFFSWLQWNKQSIVVIIYGLAFAMNAFALGVVSIYDSTYLPQKDSEITPQSEVVYPNVLEPGSFLDIMFSIYTYLITISTGLFVVGTAILLHHYSKRIGRLKFWTIVTLPLIYNVVSSIDNFGLYTPATDAEWFNWLLFGSLNSTGGGMLFGIAFWTIGKTLRQESAPRHYIRFATFGFILLFISNQASPSGAPYPPYGIVTMTFLPLSAYMIFLGVSSTAISISQDNQLRKSIKKFVTQDSNLLSSIGTAQMEQEIQRTVNSMKHVVQEKEKELEEQTGIEANMAEDEMKNYLEQVMQEVGKVNKPSS